MLGRLAVSEAQLRRAFFENQLKETKENLVRAEQALQATQEKSGMIVLDKQAEALIGGAAQLRAQITEREVQLKVLRTSATEQNPDVMRLSSELRALRTELARMESSQGAGSTASAVEMPVGRIPSASIDYVRARRELKLQETLLEGMVRQYEIAKLDEAKEGPTLQQVDVALPPDRKSKPSRALIVIVATVLALLASTTFVVLRRYKAFVREHDPTAPRRGRACRRPGACGDRRTDAAIASALQPISSRSDSRRTRPRGVLNVATIGGPASTTGSHPSDTCRRGAVADSRETTASSVPRCRGAQPAVERTLEARTARTRAARSRSAAGSMPDARRPTRSASAPRRRRGAGHPAAR